MIRAGYPDRIKDAHAAENLSRVKAERPFVLVSPCRTTGASPASLMASQSWWIVRPDDGKTRDPSEALLWANRVMSAVVGIA